MRRGQRAGDTPRVFNLVPATERPPKTVCAWLDSAARCAQDSLWDLREEAESRAERAKYAGQRNELVDAGVPKERIVLAFKPPYVRPYTEFAPA